MRRKFILCTLAGAVISILFVSPCFSEITVAPFTDSIQPIQPLDPNILTALLPVASAAYSRECSDASPVHNGNITLKDTNKIDVYRCVRWLNGNFKLIPEDNRFHQLGFPYLYFVSGDFEVTGLADLDEFYLPVLQRIHGNMTIDFKEMFEYLQLPSLKKGKKLIVHFRTMSVDLNGLNAITQLGSLELINDVNDPDLLLNGLQGLTQLTTLKITSGGVVNPTTNTDLNDGGFLESLVSVDGDVTIDTTGMSEIYGVGNINHIAGDVIISGGSGDMTNLAGLERFTLIDGTLNIHDAESLNSVAGFGQLTVGRLKIEDNPGLTSLDGLFTGNALNVAVKANGSVTIDNNPNVDCAEIAAYTSLLDPSVNINTPDCP